VSVELRELRYFVAVAEELHFTRAAERLHMAQPPLSAAIRRLEQRLGAELLERTSRSVRLTAAGAVLLERGRALLEQADALEAAVREVDGAPVGRVALGLSPTARFGPAPALLAACANAAPGVMLYPREDTTGALLRELRAGRLDLALAFCPPPDDGLARARLADEPAVAHLPAAHPLAGAPALDLAELARETFVVAGGPESPGFTRAVLDACAAAGFTPRTVPDPFPDLGARAVRDGLGVVLYVRCAFPPEPPEGSAFVPVRGVTLPFDLLWRPGPRTGALTAVLAASGVAAA
jgi:DNA-binding transcriptional LysR family regulator